MIKRYWNISLKEMIDVGMIFGHGNNKWNPNMSPYIIAKCNNIYIINITITARSLSESCSLVIDAASRGKEFLIVGIGTKNKTSLLIASEAQKIRCHYVNKKWFCGMLTNWSTTENLLQKLRNLTNKKNSGKINILPKKDASIVNIKLNSLKKYMGGIKYMTRLPDIVIIIDQNHEFHVIRECIILGIPTIYLIDTNSDPEHQDIYIPYNNESIASINFIITKLVSSILIGLTVRDKKESS
uniref:Small ribosomal subunit protein uS2c n=1 Tax=Gastrodia peichatieniana TaxID=2974004 RepID=A0A976UFB7_9ASPA|nr:ribosomal protein S2 [Gastrodia peichatieniana]UVG40925.1 ribosomal protein S2 [Gastrodia peichatieniana]